MKEKMYKYSYNQSITVNIFKPFNTYVKFKNVQIYCIQIFVIFFTTNLPKSNTILYVHTCKATRTKSIPNGGKLFECRGGVDGLGACVRNQGLTFDLLYPFNVLFLKRLQNVIYNYQEVY